MSPSLHDHNTWWYGLGQGNGDGAGKAKALSKVSQYTVSWIRKIAWVNYSGLADHIAFQFYLLIYSLF